MKPYPFMLKETAFSLREIKIGQTIMIKEKPVIVTKIVSIRVLFGDLLEIIGMCKEESQ